MATDLTCIITGHREGRLAVASLRSFWAAVEAARAAGWSVEPILCLDNPDQLTRSVFASFRNDAAEIQEYEFGDQGKVRNAAIGSPEAGAKGRYAAFLDADDLWSSDWLVQAMDFVKDQPPTCIAHPAYNYFFEKQATIYCHIDQEDPEFRSDLIRMVNYWDALCVCPTETYREIPFSERNIAGGYAYEDWVWNQETIAAGKLHKVVPDTVLFKRRQKRSQTIQASQNRSLCRPTSLHSYDNQFFSEQG